MSGTMIDRNYWERYYDAATVAAVKALRQSAWIQSTGVRLHLDVYAQADPSAPVIVMNHGGGGYSRMFAGVALRLHALGYTVVMPDQRGQGYSEGDRGDFTMGQFVQNVVDAVGWVRTQFSGVVVVWGGSVGSALVYAAAQVLAADGRTVDGVICHNLYDFGPGGDALAVSRLAGLRQVPGVTDLSAGLMGLGARIAPGLRIPFAWLGDFRAMVDARDAAFYPVWRADPAPIRGVTLRYLANTFRTPPQVALEDNRLPVAVINPMRDRMVSPQVTRENYERLGGPKRYYEIDYGHWAANDQFYDEYAALLDGIVGGELVSQQH